MYDYKVLWDAGRGNAIFDVLAASTFGQVEYTTTAALIPGKYYQFKVIAVNNIGDSAPSQAVSIIAATTPDPPKKPTLVFSNETDL